jgi:putative effector of murein hydrolase LrgA (UPF0299 family)
MAYPTIAAEELMLNWIVVVLGLQPLGELAATASGLPIPGPVIGMVLPALVPVVLRLLD